MTTQVETTDVINNPIETADVRNYIDFENLMNDSQAFKYI